MTDSPIPSPLLLAEILRLQRWAGGDNKLAARTFGLMHGFESVIREENESFGISEETQDKVEDLLADIQSGKLSTGGMTIKDRLRDVGVNEDDAAIVIELCRLQGRFLDGIDKLIQGSGSVFGYLAATTLPEQGWYGALHYMELVDCSEGARKKLHSVCAPAVPRVGEFVTPQGGSPMRVVAVDHVVMTLAGGAGRSQHCLIPYVCLEPISEGNEE